MKIRGKFILFGMTWCWDFRIPIIGFYFCFVVFITFMPSFFPSGIGFWPHLIWIVSFALLMSVHKSVEQNFDKWISEDGEDQ